MYGDRKGNESCVVLNGQRGEGFYSVTDPVISPDGRKIAFGARKSVTDPKTYLSSYEIWWKVMDVH